MRNLLLFRPLYQPIPARASKLLPLKEASGPAEMPKSFWHSFGENPIPLIAPRVGRPRKPPSITPITRPDGSVGFRVRAVVLGDDRRKIVGTIDEARLLAAQWVDGRAEELRVLPTRLSPAQLGDAEAASRFLDGLGLGFLDAAKWLLANYKRPSHAEWEAEVTEYEADRRRVGISESQISNVAKAAKRFSAHVARPSIGAPTRAEIEGFLGTLGPEVSPYTYNGLLGDLGTFLQWLVTKGRLQENPAAGMERRRIKRKLPPTLKPPAVEALLRDLEASDPEWVPYAALCVFGAMRPGTREGEAFRLDADLRAGREVFHPGGIEIHGKAHGTRIVPWDMCGPLKAWLDAYPPRSGLWPSDSPTAAERAWEKVREKHSLSADVLRHTAISAMCYAPGASLAKVAIAVGNSEPMIRKHYLGRWSDEMTQALWALRPMLKTAMSA